MKALTIQQPWAWAIAAGHKRVENRKVRTNYRGPIAIHAGKSDAWLADGLDFLARFDLLPEIMPGRLVFGAVIAVAELVDCAACTQPGLYSSPDREDLIADPFAFGPWCYVLANVRPLVTPFPCRGQQGFFQVDLPEEIKAA